MTSRQLTLDEAPVVRAVAPTTLPCGCALPSSPTAFRCDVARILHAVATTTRRNHFAFDGHTAETSAAWYEATEDFRRHLGLPADTEGPVPA